MIDMVFILLIFFIVTTVFVDEVGMGVDKPEPSLQPRPQEDREPVVFHILGNGQVLHAEREVSHGEVRSLVEAALSLNPERAVIVKAQRSASAGQMVQVIDHARLGKALKVSVAALDQ